MSRQSPLGFLFSIVFEIAAVVAIVSFLPRIDLRPREASAAAPVQPNRVAALPPDQTITPVGWTDFSRPAPQPGSHETSYYQRPAAQPAPEIVNATPATPRPSPPLLPAPPADPAYIEQRLDRASQQLVNTVGSAVSNTTSNFLGSAPQPAASTLPPPPQSFPAQNANAVTPAAPQLNFDQPTTFGQPTTTKPARRFAAESPAKSMRPWLRY